MTKLFISFFLILSFGLLLHAQELKFDSISTLQCKHPIKGIELNSSSKKLFMYQKGEVWLHDLEEGKTKIFEVDLKDSIEKKNQYYRTKFSPNGKYIAFYNIGDSILIYKKRWGKYRRYKTLFASKRVATADINDKNELFSGGSHGEINSWSLRSGKKIDGVPATAGVGQVYFIQYLQDRPLQFIASKGSSEAEIYNMDGDSIAASIKIDQQFQPDPSVAWSSAIPEKIVPTSENTFWMKIYNRPNHLLRWHGNSVLSTIPLSVYMTDFTVFQEKPVVVTASGEIFVHTKKGRSILTSIPNQLGNIKGVIGANNSPYLIAWNTQGKLQIWKLPNNNKLMK